MIKKSLILIVLLLCSISIVMAHGDEPEGHHDEDMQMNEAAKGAMDHSMHQGTGLAHQIGMSLPFSHLAEGHWVAGLLLTLLWACLLYTLYALVIIPLTKKKPQKK